MCNFCSFTIGQDKIVYEYKHDVKYLANNSKLDKTHFQLELTSFAGVDGHLRIDDGYCLTRFDGTAVVDRSDDDVGRVVRVYGRRVE